MRNPVSYVPQRVRAAFSVRRTAAAALCCAALAGGAWGAAAAEPGAAGLRIELNKLEARKDACRAYLLLENRTGHAYRTLKLDLVMFDTDGIVIRRLAVNGAPLSKAKTSLKVFDVAGVPCSGIGRILVNDVLSCDDADGARTDCLAAIATASRSDTALIK